MLCPVCDQQQVIVEFHDVELDLCIDGHGIWFDDQELHMLLDSAEAGDGLKTLEQSFRPATDAGSEAKKKCPRCRSEMDHVIADAEPDPVTLDRCPHGHGLWFDQGELTAVLRTHLADDQDALGRICEHLSQFEAGPAPEREAEEEH